ncbi:hypothetical protein BU15DRAFT_65816 [Melanogaster broomeanus]|nr:hypothetical protein BU15DRAFT_65816 [Melanogaster broomeanus]
MDAPTTCARQKQKTTDETEPSGSSSENLSLTVDEAVRKHPTDTVSRADVLQQGTDATTPPPESSSSSDTDTSIVEPDGKVYALKSSWQDVAHEPEGPERQAVREILKVMVDKDSTLRTIMGFTDPLLETIWVEDRVLEVSITQLNRPVQFFWSIQDFVKGLIGGLQGHQFLTSIGVLHRDISENNFVLGRHPQDVRGCIMDIDMATNNLRSLLRSFRLGKELPQAPQTGTLPYMSIRFQHTHFDDVKSFFYVLVLFFIAYKGPLSKQELLAADTRCFTSDVRVKRPGHLASWPEEFKKWTKEKYASQSKLALMFPEESPGVTDPLYSTVAQHWGDELLPMIQELIDSCLSLFHASGRSVHHQQFIDTLDVWLTKYPAPLPDRNNCPFEDPATGEQ